MTGSTDATEVMMEAARQYAAGRVTEAGAMAAAALAIDPTEPQAQHLLGLCRLLEGRTDEGVALLVEALAQQPSNDELRMNLARMRAHLGEHKEVVELLDPLVLRRTDLLEAYQLLAAAKWDLDDKPGAIIAYNAIVDQSPLDAAAHRNLGNALLQFRDPVQATGVLSRAVALDPSDLEAQVLLVESEWETVMRHHAGHPDELAIANKVRTLLKDLDDPIKRLRLAIILARTNQFDDAACVLEQHMEEVEPSQRLSLLLELSNLRSRQLRLEEVEALLLRAKETVPDDFAAPLNHSLLQLLLGRFEQGWRDYEVRRVLLTSVMPNIDVTAEPWIAPQNLHGQTVRVVLEQGLGDTLNFIRYVPMLAERGARVEVASAVHSTMVPLLKGMKAIAAEVPDSTTEPVPDVVVPLVSLPLAFGTRLETIPSEVPYLSVPEEYRTKWQRLVAERTAGRSLRPRVGVVWSGSTSHANDRYRSIPLEQFRRIMERDDLEFHVLADRMRDGDADALGDLAIVHSDIEDFGDTGALVEMMDLVVCVDTSVGHLAGALGRPVWVMLPVHPDWRWLMGRDDSPWYPTMRLFRQPKALDWDTVIARISEALDERYA